MAEAEALHGEVGAEGGVDLHVEVACEEVLKW